MATFEQVSRRNRARKSVESRIDFWTEHLDDLVDVIVDGKSCNAQRKLAIAQQELIDIDNKKERTQD